jgi:hypothetical protein
MECSNIALVLPLFIVHAGEDMREELVFADRVAAIALAYLETVRDAPDDVRKEAKDDYNDDIRDLVCFGPRDGSGELDKLQERWDCPRSEPSLLENGWELREPRFRALMCLVGSAVAWVIAVIQIPVA